MLPSCSGFRVLKHALGPNQGEGEDGDELGVDTGPLITTAPAPTPAPVTGASLPPTTGTGRPASPRPTGTGAGPIAPIRPTARPTTTTTTEAGTSGFGTPTFPTSEPIEAPIPDTPEGIQPTPPVRPPTPTRPLTTSFGGGSPLTKPEATTPGTKTSQQPISIPVTQAKPDNCDPCLKGLETTQRQQGDRLDRINTGLQELLDRLLNGSSNNDGVDLTSDLNQLKSMLQQLISQVENIQAAVNGVQESLDYESVVDVDISPCSSEPGTDMATYSGSGLEGLAAVLAGTLTKLDLIQREVCEQQAIATVPEWWQIRAGADRPQLVILYRELRGDGKLGQSAWSSTVPHPRQGLTVETIKSLCPDYAKGQHYAKAVLADNSKIWVNAGSQSEAESVARGLLSLVEPTMASDVEIATGKSDRKASTKRVRAVRADYYPHGQTNLLPAEQWHLV